jgi:nucleoside-diphosphate-sugar epimerase
MTNELLEAHRRGDLDVTIGRASDFFGPGVNQSALGEQVIRPALAGRRAQVMGKPDLPHSYSYAPDVATGLIALGAAPAAGGEIWHLPIGETLTTRVVIDAVYRAAGHPTRLTAAGRIILALIGVVKPELRELRHTLYQFTEPWVVDDTKFRATFGDLSTPLSSAIESTVHWYRNNPAKETP